MSANSQPVAFVNARLACPESGYDGPGTLIVKNGVIADLIRRPAFDNPSDDLRIIDCGGALLAPALIDLRVKTGEPGSEPKETLKSASLAAAAGGVATIVVQPDTDPAIDDPAMVEFILRRARSPEGARVLPAGAATRGCKGDSLAEIGLMREAGAVYFTDADHPIADSRVFRRVLSYAKGFGAMVANRPADPHLSAGACATEGELAARLGLPSVPACAERIMLERDLALAELTGAKLLVDQITTGDALAALARARDRRVDVRATASINHLRFNEVDISDYRTFCRLDPPLRSEDDRNALVEGLASGLIEVVVSAHSPAPAEDKRLPFSEAAPGAVGLETLLPALLALVHEGRMPLLTALRAVTLAPARLLGLSGGRLSSGATADLVLCDMHAPRIIDADKLLSKSKNSPFDGRRLEGRVLMTLIEGRIVWQATP